MELLLGIIAHALEQGEIDIMIGKKTADISLWVEGKCYQTLKKIQAIVTDDRLDDPQCFVRIEEIIIALEELGIGGGFRHDFGY